MAEDPTPKEISFLATASEFKKYREKRELTSDEFINLYKIIKSYSEAISTV